MELPEKKNVGMDSRPKSSLAGWVVVLLIIAAAAFFSRSYWMGGAPGGAKGPQAQGFPPKQAPSVVLHVVENADLAGSSEYLGRVESIQTVLLKPQVPAEIAQVHFKEGAIVKAGQLLFSLDNKQYAATVALRRAELDKATANYERASKYYARLKAADAGSVSAADIDLAQSDVLQGKALVEQAKAALQMAQIDLGYTKITAPITGQIGQAFFTKGNYVTPAGGPLAKIVQIDPVRVGFALPDKDYLQQMKLFRASSNAVYNATIRLANGELYPFKGQRDFEDNTIDDKTGTIMMHLRFKNSEGLLVPGAMVRVGTKAVKTHIAAVIPQEAILTDTQGDYVYVVDGKNITHQRRVKLGMEIGTMREVTHGLSAGEKIIAQGLQSVYPEIEVKPAPLHRANEAKTPAEQAMESVNDLHVLSPDSSADKQESAEGKN